MTQLTPKEYGLVSFSFADEAHLNALAHLIEQYKNDPMGQSSSMEPAPFTERQKFKLIVGLEKNTSCRIFLWNVNFKPVAIAVCFEGFSTFLIQPTINIHDFCVDESFRNSGVGSEFMHALVSDFINFGYGKITLEVREDNEIAQRLYKKFGFAKTEPNMLFWTKQI